VEEPTTTSLSEADAMRDVPTIAEPVPILKLTPQEIETLTREIRGLARERDAVILAHNYQVPEIQDVADHVGDSLGLARQAAAADEAVIVFCGVHFMAETASVLSPDKTVLLPDLGAGCSLADSITAHELRNWKQRHPGAVVVSYVNTSAAVKAETDYCCTSANAVQVVEHVYREHGSDTEILFGPDMWLGTHVERIIGKRMHLWPGECHVHAGITAEAIERVAGAHPSAELLVHPECGALEAVLGASETRGREVHVGSTGGMERVVARKPEAEYVVATEVGMLHPLRKRAPAAHLWPANDMAVCTYMKQITLPKLRDSLRDLKHVVEVSAEVAVRARAPIERMIAIG
jgi:quinolinate synthase